MKNKKEYTLRNIFAYLQGNLRYRFYYSKYFKFLIRSHIREQIEYRINSMDRECYSQGYCKICGCQTTHLQMADKACDKPCYPKMMKKKQWKNFKKQRALFVKNDFWRLNLSTKEFEFFKDSLCD